MSPAAMWTDGLKSRLAQAQPFPAVVLIILPHRQAGGGNWRSQRRVGEASSGVVDGIGSAVCVSDSRRAVIEGDALQPVVVVIAIRGSDVGRRASRNEPGIGFHLNGSEIRVRIGDGLVAGFGNGRRGHPPEAVVRVRPRLLSL